MRVWFKSIAAMLGIDDTEERTVRQVLDAAVARSAVVGLCANEFDAYPDPDCCVLEAIEDDSLVLVAVGAARRSDIVPGARFHMAIGSSRGFHHGETTVMSRWMEHDERGVRQRSGFRVSIPTSLTHVQRRVTHRVPVAFDLAPSAILTIPESDAPPCKATVMDLSETGMRVRVPITQTYEIGQQVEVDARFPDTIPSFKSTCTVVRVAPLKAREVNIVGLRFSEPLSELSGAIRALDLRRGNRPAA
jgi:hypothetical protein